MAKPASSAARGVYRLSVCEELGMRRCIALGLGLAATTLVTFWPDLAAASPLTVADWQMNEPPGATVMHDSAGGHDGRIGPGITTNGSTYAFTGRGEVTVPSAPDLNPGLQSFEMTARVAVAPHNKSDYSIIQKGLYHQGGQWKMQVTWNVAICTFGLQIVNGPLLTGGTFHTISCIRNPDDIQVVVDGRTVTKEGAVGNLTNDFPVTVGGKPPNQQQSHDYFIGQMDYITLKTL
jgi:hypothetical protein